MYPEWFSLAGGVKFDATVLPHAQRALPVINAWCYNLLYPGRQVYHHHQDPKLFTLFCQITKIFIAVGRQDSERLLNDSFLGNIFRNNSSFLQKLGNGEAYIIPMVANCLSHVNDTSLQWGACLVQYVLSDSL